MVASIPSSTVEKFTTFGDLLRFLRRRAGVTQMELAIAVGYSDAQISRLEQNLRLPDIPTVEARFVSALDLENEPKALARLLELAANVRREDAPALGLCPYRGLSYFDENDADLFVGREALTAKLAERVLTLPSEARFLSIVGASGSGKSSLVRAGLIPALRWSQETADWQIHVLTPTARPLENLAAELTRGNGSVTAIAAGMDDMAREPRSLHLLIKRRTKAGNASRFLLVVDQFEELFALCRSEEERKAFVDNLLTASTEADGPTIVVITLRADFYAACAAYPQLREAVAKRQEYMGAMTSDELRRVIEEPARRGRWEFEPGLVDLLLHDVGHEPGALPLLSHALLETWERRRGHTMTLSGYTASGGVRGAIAETAEAVFTDQFDHKQQAIARRIFVRLTELGDETNMGDTRRRASFSELILKPEETETTQAVLKALADARLITMGEDAAEVAHEALIREWPTLRGWLEDNRDGLRLHRQMTEATLEWSGLNRDQDLLFRGARLAQAREWAATHADEMNSQEREFLKASVDQSERDLQDREDQRQRELQAAQKLAATERRASLRLRRRALYLAAAFAIALIMALTALVFGDQARLSAVAAGVSAKQAEAETSIATSRELAAAAVSNLDSDPQLSLLLALQAIRTSDTLEAENSLHRSILASRVSLILRNGAQVWSVTYSPDGKRLATASQDKTAKVWDAATGQLLLTLVGHTDSVNGIAFSPDGTRIATTSDDHTARIWDAATGKELLTLIGHQSIVARVAFSPDGKRLATTSRDGSARIWDAATGQELLTLQYSEPQVGVAISPDGTRLATAIGSTGESVKVKAGVIIWDLSTGKQLMILSSTAPYAFAGVALSPVAFSPDGTRVAAASTGGGASGHVQAIEWDATTGQELVRFTGHAQVISSLAFSPDGKWLATGSSDRTARIWDAATGQELISLTGHSLDVNGVAFSPDGTHLATASWDGTAAVWDITPARELLHVGIPAPAGGGAWQVGYSPDGTQILANLSSNTYKVLNAVSGAELPAFEGVTAPTLINSYMTDGSLISVTLVNKAAGVLDAKTGAARVTLSGPLDATDSAAITPDGRRLVNYRADSTASVWDLQTGREVSAFKTNQSGNTSFVDCVADSGGKAGCVALSPDGRRLVTSDSVATANIQNATNAGADTRASVWDADTGQRLLTLLQPAHTGIIWFTSFSPDGSRIATAGDGGANIWDASTGKLLLTLSGHKDSVFSIKFSPDGRMVATDSADGTVKLWNAVTGVNLLTLPVDNSTWFGDLAFNPDGKHLAVADATGLNVFVLPIQDAIALAETRVIRSLTTQECQQYLHTAGCPAGP